MSTLEDIAAGRPLVLVVMGVSGSGKTTVAELVATRLGWELEEGDELHPLANVEKMAAGQPLDDTDRAPWLDTVAEWIDGQIEAGKSGIITCSALKRAYRDRLNRRGDGVIFVYLAGDRATIAGRLSGRKGHFMPAALLDSQFADLEEPGEDEPAVRVSVGAPPQVIADNIVESLDLDDDRP